MTGHAALVSHVRIFPKIFDVEFVDLTFHATIDPSLLIAEFRSTGTALPTGNPYEQTCISVVRTNDDALITHYLSAGGDRSAYASRGHVRFNVEVTFKSQEFLDTGCLASHFLRDKTNLRLHPISDMQTIMNQFWFVVRIAKLVPPMPDFPNSPRTLRHLESLSFTRARADG